MSAVLLEVITPDRVVVSKEVNMIVVRGGDGELGILPRHAPLATTVKPGLVRVKVDQGEDYIHVSGGFLEVLPDRVSILADAAELASSVDVERAELAKQRAESRLAQQADGVDQVRAELALMRANNRLRLVELSNQHGNLLSHPDPYNQ